MRTDDPMSPNGPDPSPEWEATIERIAEDLRRVAATRSPKAMRDAHLPELERILEVSADPERSHDELRKGIEAGITAITDEQFQKAAQELFSFGPHRWTPLRTRGERASASFGCSFDAFRRARRSTGKSLLDETIAQLATGICRNRVARDSARPSDPSPVSASIVDAHAPLPQAGTPTQPKRRQLALVLSALIVIVGATLGTALYRRARPQPAPSALPSTVRLGGKNLSQTSNASCRFPIGTSSDPKLQRFKVAFQTQVSQVTPPGDPQPCGSASVTVWGELTVQLLETNGIPDGALVATDPDNVIQMSQAEYSSYHQVGGKDGTQAQTLAGLPRKRETTKSGRLWLIVTDHGAMVSQGVDQPGFYVGGPAWTRWQATDEDQGEMGYPTSNPLNNAVGYYQDYSTGRLTLSYSGTLTFDTVDDPSASLPAHYVGQILRHNDGTTWFVDSKRVRHWIPDGGTWTCIHRRGAQELGGIPGYAIATLPLGPPASCNTPN